MALGDVVVFNEAKGFMIDGGWEAADDIKCAVCDNTVTPTAATITPTLSDFTEVGTAGSYAAGGISLGNLGTCVTVTGATMKFTSATNPSWAQNALNDVDAYWGIIYHVTSGQAIAFVDLGGPVNMATGSLTITWNASGIFTIT